MEHLSQEELLLLADGELAEERAVHLDACSTCRAAAGALQGQLTAITAQLQAAAPVESPENHSASWARLEAAIRGETDVLSTHLIAEELLLHLDDELAPERALHLESCEQCHDELLRVQALLCDVEHELRALMPPDSRERRMAAAAALEREIYPPKKVVSFPVRWGAVYAAAAAMTFAVFGGLWMSRQPAATPEAPVAALEAPAVPAQPVATPAPGLDETAKRPEPVAAPTRVAVNEAVANEAGTNEAVVNEIVASAPVAVEPSRFEPVAVAAARTPAERALVALDTLEIRPAAADSLALAWSSPTLLPVAPALPPVVKVAAADPETLIAGLSAAVRSGAWEHNVAPEIRNGRLTFTGAAESASERDDLIAALRRELGRRDAAFDIAVTGRAAGIAGKSARRSLGDRPAGGMMRSALLEHYSDAARRSFQQPTQSGLEAEIARFATEIYRNQSSLVRHAHALSTILADSASQALSPEAAKSLAGLVRFHANGVAESEAAIYDHLSEALPRRYWNHRGDRQALADADMADASGEILSDALRLDETLTTLLGSSAGTVDAGEVETSAGALLYRIRTRARNLTSGLDSIR